MGNGAKRAQKQERKNDTKKGPTSQLKSNAVANNTHKCTFCKQGFQGTSKKATLELHVPKHKGKTFEELFPDFVESA